MEDLDELVLDVWSPEARRLASDAVRTYRTGSYRAAIVLAWVAATVDLMQKVKQLAEDGDGVAKALSDRVERARSLGLHPDGVRQIQEIERDLLDAAESLELIDHLGKRNLLRLREDRHLCAHPSLDSDGGFFEPRAELARAHLGSLLRDLLVHPPVQGRRAVERFIAYLSDRQFTESADHILHTYFDGASSPTRRAVVDLAVKHAALQLDPGDDTPVTAAEVARRSGVCVDAFARRDRALVAEAVDKIMPRLAEAGGDAQLGALARLGALDCFWDKLPEPLAGRLADLVRQIPEPGWDTPLDEVGAAALSLCANDAARGALPVLADRFETLGARYKAEVIAQRPAPYFAPSMPALLRDAGGWRTAEAIAANALLPVASSLNHEQLHAALEAWADNTQCRTASRMVDYAVQLFERTVHLLPDSIAAWDAFLARVRELEDHKGFYVYEDLAAAVDRYRP